jgi:hypothetical protein
MAVTRRTKPKETVEVSETDIDWIKTTLSSMSLKLQEVDGKFNKLNQTVIGDDAYGQIGLVKQVKDNTDYIEKDKQFKSRLVGGGLVLSAIWGLVLKFWKI